MGEKPEATTNKINRYQRLPDRIWPQQNTKQTHARCITVQSNSERILQKTSPLHAKDSGRNRKKRCNKARRHVQGSRLRSVIYARHSPVIILRYENGDLLLAIAVRNRPLHSVSAGKLQPPRAGCGGDWSSTGRLVGPFVR